MNNERVFFFFIWLLYIWFFVGYGYIRWVFFKLREFEIFFLYILVILIFFVIKFLINVLIVLWLEKNFFFLKSCCFGFCDRVNVCEVN